MTENVRAELLHAIETGGRVDALWHIVRLSMLACALGALWFACADQLTGWAGMVAQAGEYVELEKVMWVEDKAYIDFIQPSFLGMRYLIREQEVLGPYRYPMADGPVQSQKRAEKLYRDVESVERLAGEMSAILNGETNAVPAFGRWLVHRNIYDRTPVEKLHGMANQLYGTMFNLCNDATELEHHLFIRAAERFDDGGSRYDYRVGFDTRVTGWDNFNGDKFDVRSIGGDTVLIPINGIAAHGGETLMDRGIIVGIRFPDHSGEDVMPNVLRFLNAMRELNTRALGRRWDVPFSIVSRQQWRSGDHFGVKVVLEYLASRRAILMALPHPEGIFYAYIETTNASSEWDKLAIEYVTSITPLWHPVGEIRLPFSPPSIADLAVNDEQYKKRLAQFDDWNPKRVSSAPGKESRKRMRREAIAPAALDAFGDVQGTVPLRSGKEDQRGRVLWSSRPSSVPANPGRQTAIAGYLRVTYNHLAKLGAVLQRHTSSPI